MRDRQTFFVSRFFHEFFHKLFCCQMFNVIVYIKTIIFYSKNVCVYTVQQKFIRSGRSTKSLLLSIQQLRFKIPIQHAFPLRFFKILKKSPVFYCRIHFPNSTIMPLVTHNAKNIVCQQVSFYSVFACIPTWSHLFHVINIIHFPKCKCN